MEGASTESLRALAPKWSLAGDDHLLNLLQSTHQRIISKCQDVTSKLEEMASALDDASINLRNVNNKFMALSNAQFVESRVYDDDAELYPDTQPAEVPPPPPTTVDELSMLRRSLAVLERAHETAEILDDSDSDSDAEISVVLKPRDLYSHRPLPYIIGTQPWKNKWHAGLLADDSDSDSSTSKQDARDVDLYSESASEAEETPGPALEERTISETSSLFHSERVVEFSPKAQPQPKPSDLAAELARRLGGVAQAVPEVEDSSPPLPTTRKVYKPEQPATSTIFPDEPPPLDVYEQDETQSEDDDIFAEINKNKPYKQRNTVQNNLAEDLFNFDKPDVEQGDIFSDFAAGNVKTKPAKQKSTLFEDESEPESFAEPPQRNITQNNNIQPKQEEISTKKPVGGISLFGSSEGADSIGAAILKRNQRKSSTSGEESGNEVIQNQSIEEKSVAKSKATDETDNKPVSKNEKDIFDDLFAKPEPKKKPAQKIIKEPSKDKEKTHVKDLFSDNIFDDIDDIFTSNVKMPTKESNQKSIFEEDDDDLFSDIAKPISKDELTSTKDKEIANSKDKKSIFDSDDELFSESVNKSIRNPETNINKASNANYNHEAISKIENIVKPTETTKERNLFDDSPQIQHKSDLKPQPKSKSIFDSDSDDDIFAGITKTDNKKSNNTDKVLNSDIENNKPVDTEHIYKSDSNQKVSTQNLKVKEKTNAFKVPSLFEEDEIDDLFVNANKLNTDSNVSKETKIAEVKSISSVLKDTIIGDINTENEIDTAPRVDSTENNNLPKKVNEIEQNITKKSVTFASQEIAIKASIFDDSLTEDDIFSSLKETQEVAPSQIVSKEIVTTEVIESSPDVKESKTEETKSAFNEQTVITQPQLKDIETPEFENAEKVIESHKAEEQEANRSVFDDFMNPVKENEVVITKGKKPISNEPNVFDDIFTEPPAFEKPAEPKKSKNVNALFDDDSDDESLFFKKNDVISDEKPEIFIQNANFDIFVDEPPAIDVDFTTKSAKNIDLNDDDDDLFSSVSTMEENMPRPTRKLNIGEYDEDLFSSVAKTQEIVRDNAVPETREKETKVETPKTSHEESKSENKVEKHSNTDATKLKKNVTNVFSKGSDSDDDLFSGLPIPNKLKSSQKDELFEQNKTFNTNLAEKTKTSDEFDDIFKSNETTTKDTETKKIGKLNTKNFNINVNALIPGASPKKVPKEREDEQITPESENVPETVKILPAGDETDNYQPKPPSNKNGNDKKNPATEDKEPEAAKLMTFEEKSDSGVLDNNLSKQRPRIQVKRRPSSRRARHEAARKSAIDFGDDTDNSSSFDEPVKSKSLTKENRNDTKQKHAEIANQTQDLKQDKMNDTNNEVSSSETTVKTNFFENEKSNIPSSNSEKDSENLNEPSASSNFKTETKNVTQNIEQKQGSTTKIVYILNDEDIFNTGPKNIEKNIDNETSSDIFKNIGVKTLGKTYKEDTKEVIKKDEITSNIVKNDENNAIKVVKSSQITKSLFDDSDEELFNEKKKTAKKTTIFDSDSEEDLFSGKKTTEKQNKEQKNKKVKGIIEVKGSLFGDEDEDDDGLFGVKKEKIETINQAPVPSTSKEATGSIASKSAKAVFDDPLSMLGDD